MPTADKPAGREGLGVVDDIYKLTPPTSPSKEEDYYNNDYKLSKQKVRTISVQCPYIIKSIIPNENLNSYYLIFHPAVDSPLIYNY